LAYLTSTSPLHQADNCKLNERPKLVNGTGNLDGRIWVVVTVRKGGWFHPKTAVDVAKLYA
jgi:hypothetical protein